MIRPSNRASIRNISDYSPFGVQLSERTISGDGYRFGFGSMEKDDELKGSGNSYDFGARMYDPRVGRWLTIDPLAARQPDQSPYKAFLNNPIIWSDPDGRIEFLTIIVKDESSGKSMKISIPVSEQIMTDGRKHAKGNNATWHYENAYYDFARVTKITIKKNGDIMTTQYTEILKDRGVKDWDYIWFGGNKWGDKQDEPSYKMKGGFYMTGSGGQGTKYYSDNAEDIGNVDGLIGALGGLGSLGISKMTPTISPEEVLNFIKAVSEATGHMDNIEEMYKEVKKVVTPDSEGKKENTRPKDTYRCPTCSEEFPASDTTGHNQELNRESGPFEKVEKKGGN